MLHYENRNSPFKFCLLHVGAVGAVVIMEVILVRDEKIEGQSGEEVTCESQPGPDLQPSQVS